MIKNVLFGILLNAGIHTVYAQEIGEVREVRMILSDIPNSGEDYQPNFINSDTSEILSFYRYTWLDKHVSLFDFFKTYRDSCLYDTLYFNLTVIYLPVEVHNYVRYEGFFPTG